jgi:hypothetical protein
MRQGRPICWLVVVVAVVMSVMPWGTAQAGPIKWSGEGYAPWRLGDPDDGGHGRFKKAPPQAFASSSWSASSMTFFWRLLPYVVQPHVSGKDLRR